MILQAMELNPAFFKTIYADLLNSKKTRKNVQEALEAVDRYLAERAATLSGRCSITSARSAKCGRAPRSKAISSGTSVSAASRRRASIWPTEGSSARPPRRCSSPGRATSKCKSWPSFTLRNDRMASRSTARRNPPSPRCARPSPCRAARAQPQEHLGRDPARQTHRGHGALGLGQVEPGVRHDLRRGAATVHGVAVQLREAVRRSGRQAGRRFRVRPVSGDFHRAEDDRQQSALDRRHHDRHRQLSEPAVRDHR